LLACDIDAVSICTPTPTHAELAIRALQAGRHVLCEKPIARTLAQAQAMVAAAEQSGATLMIGHVSRFEADHRAARDVLQRGDLGHLRMGFQSIAGPTPNWSSNGWLADATQSGGPVVDLAIHSFDYLLWLFASPVERVTAVGVHQTLSLPSYALVTLRFANGGLGLVETSWVHPRAHGLMVRTELTGTLGRLAWDYEQISGMQVIREETGRRIMPLLGEDSFVAEIAAFVACIADGTEPPIPAREAIRALQVALAAEESLAHGRTVTLPRAETV
jgi:predicted dehydrogenase